MIFSPTPDGKLPVGQDIWFAFGIRLQDWVVSPDEQILMQWHQGDGSILLNPFLALLLKGDTLRIDSKFNAADPPSRTTTSTVTQWQSTHAPINAWTYFVLKARISPFPADGAYLKVWRDGVPIVDYRGPLGYNYPESPPYLKVGHYQWVTPYNPWSDAAPTKTVLYRSPLLVQDPAGKYSEVDLRANVMSH